MKKIKIAYFGSSDFSARFLERLVTDVSINQLIEVVFVVTQPDRPVGRKQIMTATPVKSLALKHNLKTFEIENCKLEIENCDLCLLYAYGAFIPQELLTLPRLGFWCLHPSLLPKYRGTSPMATALINGDRKTGITIIKMDEKIDHGPIIAQEKYQILATDRRPDLEKKLTDLGFEMFKKLLKGSIPNFLAPVGPPTSSASQVAKNLLSSPLKKQNHKLATYTKKLTKQNGFIPFENLKLEIRNSSEALFNRFRGLYPWPGLWTLLRPDSIGTSEGQAPKRLKITDMDFINGKLTIKKVQLEGKKEVDFETFNKAYKIF